MVDIESEKWRIRSNGSGYTIENKLTGEIISVSSIPSTTHLAAISENQFDIEMAKLFNSAR